MRKSARRPSRSATDCALARTEATRLNRPVSFTLAGSGNPGWAINIFNPVTGLLLQPPLQSYSRFEVGRSARVVTAPGTAVAVTFNGLGRIVSPSPIATPNLQQIDVTSAIAGEARTLRIFVDDLHGMRLCDPDPALARAVAAGREGLLKWHHARNDRGRSRFPQDGSALLEALVAILIFSFGVLGLVGILAASVRATNDARYRAEAANLANALIGDMWATAAADLDPQFGAGGPKFVAWQNQVAAQLPSASGANAPLVDLAQPGLSTQSRSVVVTVFWQLPGETVRHQVLVTAQIGKNT